MPTGKIEKIIAKHYSQSNWTGESAKISLWAETDLGHEVWLQTQHNLDTRRVNVKVRAYEDKNKHLLGQRIKYKFDERKEIGFVREYLSSEPAKGLYDQNIDVTGIY